MRASPAKMIGVCTGVLATAWLLACQGPNTQSVRAPAVVKRSPSAAVSSLVLTPAWQGEALRLQATITPLGPDDVATLEIELWQLDPAVMLASASLDPLATAPIAFGSLLRNRSYRALGRAYATAESSAALLISDDDHSSVTLAIGPDDASIAASLPIRLQDTEFSGTGGSSGTLIIPGSLTYPDEETLVLGP